MGAVFFPAEITVKSFIDEGPAAGGVSCDEGLTHAGSFQQAQGQAFPVGGEDDAIGLFDHRSHLARMSHAVNESTIGPFFSFLPRNRYRPVLAKKNHKLTADGESLSHSELGV